jgi:hypothetical protein
MAATPSLPLWNLTPERLRGVQHHNGRAAIYDVLALLTGADSHGAGRMWSALAAAHPALANRCEHTRLPSARPGAGYRETPTLDTSGLVELLMAIEGPADLETRLAAARDLVELIEGDTAFAAPSEADGLESEAAPEETLAEWVIDPLRLEGIRTKNGLMCLYDMMQVVSGQSLASCSRMWDRLTTAHPELLAL